MKKNHEFALQWLHKAGNDLVTAEKILQISDGPTDTVCFHAQQTVEKALKGLLTHHNIPFPKIHHLVRLLDMVAPYHKELESFREQCAVLSNYAVEMRYPGVWDDPEREDAMEAVTVAKNVLNLIEKKLKK